MVELQLTPQGTEAAKVLPGSSATVLNEELRGFSGADLATLIDLLARFIANGPAGDSGCREVAAPAPPAGSSAADRNE